MVNLMQIKSQVGTIFHYLPCKSLFSIFLPFFVCLVETQMAEEMFSCLSIAEDQTQSTGLVYGYENFLEIKFLINK